MGKLETIKTLIDIGKTVVDGGIAIADARRRAREEQERKDRERAAENEKLRKPVSPAP